MAAVADTDGRWKGLALAICEAGCRNVPSQLHRGAAARERPGLYQYDLQAWTNFLLPHLPSQRASSAPFLLTVLGTDTHAVTTTGASWTQ